MAERERLNFALVGLGLVGPAHARSLKELDDARLAVVCDVDTSRDYEYTDWASVDDFVESFVHAVIGDPVLANM